MQRGHINRPEFESLAKELHLPLVMPLDSEKIQDFLSAELPESHVLRIDGFTKESVDRQRRAKIQYEDFSAIHVCAPKIGSFGSILMVKRESKTRALQLISEYEKAPH